MLLIFDTHPIQYRAPVFRALLERRPATKVYFFDHAFDGRKWWFHEVGKIPPQKWDLPLREGYPNEVLETSRLGMLGTYRALRKILKHERPSSVMTYGYYLPEHWMLRWLCARLGIPFVFVGETFQESSSFIRRMIKGSLLGYFFGGVDRFVAIGHKTSSYYQRLSIAPQRIVEARYCTDVSFFKLSAEEGATTRRRWREELGIPQDAFVQLFVGRLFERKRPRDMIALHRMLKSQPHVYTVLVGNGPMESELRAESNGEERFFLAGFRNQAQTRDAYYGCDVLVVPSEYETWGLVVNEAFACGRPAIVTDKCGTAEDLVLNGETGFVYEVGDVVRAAELLQSLVKDSAKLDRMGEAARRKVAAEYHIGQFAEAIDRATRPGPAAP